MSSNIKEGVTLKSLHSRLEKEKAELGVIQRQINELKEKSKAHNQKISNVLYQIKELTRENLTISEHAMLQFQRRVELIPVEEIEGRVITEELKRMWNVLGNGSFPIGIGEHTATIREGVITTIY